MAVVEHDAGLSRLESLLAGLTAAEFSDYLEQVRPSLTPAMLDVFERVAARRTAEGWRADPMAMALHLSPGAVRDWRYARHLARRYRAAQRGESRFQVWSQPPQTGKTTWLLRGLLWSLDDRPDRTYQYLPYGDHLAREGSDILRGWARDYEDQLSFDLRPDRQALDRWRTKQGGGVLFASLGGAVSGFTATGGVIVDDPLKNWQEAHSKAARDRAWNEIRAVAFKRLSEGAFLILAHARWHLNDPTGRMHELAEELGVEIEFVTLPMICPENLGGRPFVDPIGRRPGMVLEPERYSLAEAQLRVALDGSYMNAAMDGQDPQPEQGGEVQREWWRWTATPPEQYARVITSWDMKLKDKESGDYVVGVCVGQIGQRFWLLGMIRGQFSQLQTKVAIALMAHRHPDAHRHVVENTGNGPEVMEQLRDGDPRFVLTDALADKVGVMHAEREAVQAMIRRGLRGIVPHSPKESKLVRARRTIPLIEGGHVTLIEGRRFSDAIVDEWAAFPPRAGGHDDIVDAMTQAFDRLDKSGAKVIGDGTGSTIETPPPSVRAMPAKSGPRAQVLR